MVFRLTLNQRLATIALRVAVVAAALGLWQGLSVAGLLPQSEFPSMSATAVAFAGELAGPQFWAAVWATIKGWGLGLLIGGGSAILVGSLLGLSRFAHRSAMPVIEFLKTMPVVAILPLAILVFGTTLQMKYVLVAFGVFWPFTIQVIYGVRSIDPTVKDTARALQVRGLRRFAVVILPSAAPFIFTGLRVAAAVALILDIVTELVGGGQGLGLAILTALNSGPAAYPIMYAYIVATGLLGVLLAGMFALLERRVLHWHESQRNTRGVSRA